MKIIPKVSIIVPTYNGEETLPLCLDSLMKLNYPKGKFEIIVVDNNSTDRTKDIIKNYPVKYVFEREKGCASARNKGIEESSGEIIAFTDADCIVDKNWLKNIIKPLKNESIGGVGGKILAYSSENLIEKYIDSKDFYSQPTHSNKIKSIFLSIKTANAAFRKDALRECNGFDPIFCRSEDVDLTTRLMFAGYNIAHAPKAIIFHKHRANLINFCKWRFGVGEGVALLFFKYKKIFKMSFFRNCIWQPVVGVVNSLKRRPIHPTFFFLDIIGEIAYVNGIIYNYLKIILGEKQINSFQMSNKKNIL